MRIFRRSRRERGQGSLELVAIVTLAAVLVGSTTAVVLQSSPAVKAEISYKICQILNVAGGGACQEPSAPRTPEDRVPKDPCTVTSENISAQASASVVVTVKKGFTFLVEKMSDGTYKITKIDTSGVGTGVGPGIDVSLTLDGKKYGVTAIASADAMLAAKKGNTWIAKNEGDVDDTIKGIVADQIIDQVAPDPPFGLPNPVKGIIKHFIHTDDPDEQFVEGGLEGSAEATVSDVVIGAGASAKAEAYIGGKKTKDGSVAYFRVAVGAEGWGAVMGEDFTGTANGEMLGELNLDKDGKPKSIKLTTSVTLDGETEDGLTDHQKVTEVSYEVPLTGDMKHDAPLYAALAGAATPAGLLALPNFVKEAKANGYATQNVYDQDPNTYGLNIGGELLGEYGGSVSGDVTYKNLKDSKYWDGNGWAARPDC